MAKPHKVFSCQSCGSVYPRWMGKCDACGEWNTIIEEAEAPSIPKGLKPGKSQGLELVSLKGAMQAIPRYVSAIEEFDRVCGGGLVAGSIVLIGGDPGIGKSTLLLQVSAALSGSLPVAYISGEEAVDQIRMRAKRLGLSESAVLLAASSNVRDVLSTLDTPNGPKVVVIDSIQTMYIDNIESAPGTVTQVRGCTAELIRVAKSRDIVIILVGHVTKEGTIAGPRVLEHMVDAVFYFEGDRGHQFRILRSVKNRFGAADEIGVFEMREEGLTEVPNPSSLFLENRSTELSGVSVFAGIEGSRPLLCEIQGLVAPSPLASPRRTVVGWDAGRLAMILAVLETRCSIQMSNRDVYLNIAGGLKINEPAADLAVAACLLSSFTNTPLPDDAVIIGEIGLGGEIRPVKQIEIRLKEAKKLGFKQAIIPATSKLAESKDGISLVTVKHLSDIMRFFNIRHRRDS
jgi:DNA repair protein RadA/Sms